MAVAAAALTLCAAAGASLVAAAGAKPTPDIDALIKAAIAAEKRALKAFDTDKNAARRDLDESLSDLNSVLSNLADGSGRTFSDLKQAVLGDEIALKFLRTPVERDFARGRINIAILRKETALGIVEAKPQTPLPPIKYPRPDPPPPPPPPKPPTEVPGLPSDVLRVLELMDKRLTAAIKNLEAGSLNEAETHAAVDGIAALKTKAIGLLPTVCGLSPFEVYPVIEAAEKDLADAYYVDSHESSLAHVASAQRALEALNAGIAQLGQCPQAHDALAQLIAMLGQLQTTPQSTTAYHAALKTTLNKTMLQVWGQFPKVFGQLSFAYVSRTLNLIDYFLDQANLFAGFNFEVAIKLAQARLDKARLERAFRTLPNQQPKPSLTRIHAVFTPSEVPGCSPPACTTVYTENATGQGLTYKWTVSIPADPECAAGFHANTPQPNQASWYHADVSEGGGCNHTGTTYDAAGSGHPGTVTVTVSNESWSCAATFFGTQGSDGTATGDGPTPQPCQAKQ